MVLCSRLHFERAEPVQHHGLMCTNCKISIVLTATVDCTGPCFHHIKCRIKQEAGFRLSFRSSFLPDVTLLSASSSFRQSLRRWTPLVRPGWRPTRCVFKEGGTLELLRCFHLSNDIQKSACVATSDWGLEPVGLLGGRGGVDLGQGHDLECEL